MGMAYGCKAGGFFLHESEMVCPQCGKKFSVHGEEWGWVYRYHKLCSYSCMKAMQKADKHKLRKIPEEEERKQPMITDKETQIIRLHKGGMTIPDIAKEMDMGPNEVGRVLKTYGFLKESKIVTEQEAKAYLELRNCGMTNAEIAERFGVIPNTVRRHIRRLEKAQGDKNATGDQSKH